MKRLTNLAVRVELGAFAAMTFAGILVVALGEWDKFVALPHGFAPLLETGISTVIDFTFRYGAWTAIVAGFLGLALILLEALDTWARRQQSFPCTLLKALDKWAGRWQLS